MKGKEVSAANDLEERERSGTNLEGEGSVRGSRWASVLKLNGKSAIFSSSSVREIVVEEYTKLLKFRYGAAAKVCPSGPLLRETISHNARAGVRIIRTRVCTELADATTFEKSCCL